jgi:hypothetical protein
MNWIVHYITRYIKTINVTIHRLATFIFIVCDRGKNRHKTLTIDHLYIIYFMFVLAKRVFFCFWITNSPIHQNNTINMRSSGFCLLKKCVARLKMTGLICRTCCFALQSILIEINLLM